MSMTFEHYSHERVRFDPAFDYSSRVDRPDKPTGFWVSVAGDDDWPSWCRSEEYGDMDNAVRHSVTLSSASNVLVLSTPAELNQFDATYGVLDRIGWVGYAIDWPRLYREYDGIVIAPYQWSRRYDLHWYYMWDCASGCIWNLEAIAAVTPAPAESVAA